MREKDKIKTILANQNTTGSRRKMGEKLRGGGRKQQTSVFWNGLCYNDDRCSGCVCTRGEVLHISVEASQEQVPYLCMNFFYVKYLLGKNEALVCANFRLVRSTQKCKYCEVT